MPQVTLKAASAVHVALVRSARENERMHVAMREFIGELPSLSSRFPRLVKMPADPRRQTIWLRASRS